MAITKKQIFKTTLLPGILPRLGTLLGSGFSTLAYLIAIVYNTVRILPDQHPFLKPEMVGTYNSRQVIAEAANYIKPTRNNIDQIIIFFSIIAALIILFIQFILIGIGLLIPKAFAQDGVTIPTTIREFFITPNPEEDLAYRLLDLVFGIPDFFGSQEQTLTPIHTALHGLFEFYSLGMLIVGTLIIIYFVVAVVVETAQSGTPFGQRFNKSWAPVRIILFFGLLIPISNGLNAGQYIALTSAKLGSGLASTGWIFFNTKIETTNELLTGKIQENIATVNPADLSHVPGAMLLVKTCEYAYASQYDGGANGVYRPIWDPDGAETGVKPWAVYQNLEAKDAVTAQSAQLQEIERDLLTARGELEGVANPDGPEPPNPDDVRAAERKVESSQNRFDTARSALDTALEATAANFSAEILAGQTFTDLSEKSKGTDIHIVFGVKDPNAYENRANIRPACGSIVMKVTDVSEFGSAKIQNAYLELIKNMWAGSGDSPLFEKTQQYAENFAKRNLSNIIDPKAELPPADLKRQWSEYLEKYMGDDGGIIAQAVEAQIENGEWQLDNKMRDYGWAGGGIWYNRIAQQNGAIVAAVQQTPVTVLYPKVMEKIKRYKQQENQTTKEIETYGNYYAANTPTPREEILGENEIADALNHAFTTWEGEEETAINELTGNPFIDTVNVILGTSSLFEICKNTDIHPLAQLSSVGKSMLERAIGTFAAAGGFSIASIIPSPFSAAASSFSEFFGTVASVGLLIGFILFYVIPFLPFIYFFFAVGGWVKGIFEAMVAVPLWALAHLRIDGDGIPGQAAIGGYFLIFEIFIRPILIVFGLLASIAIFATMVKVLNEVFYLAISNLSGHDPKSNTACFQNPSAGTEDFYYGAETQAQLKAAYRGPVDEFFFTILYTIIVYMIGTAAFKLIDNIPNNILSRWANVETSAFNDDAADASEGLLTYVTLGGSQFGSQLGEKIGGIGGGVRDSFHSILR